MLPRMTLTFHRNHRDLALVVDPPPTLRVAVDPELWSLAPARAFTSDGRYEAVPVGDPTATLRVVPLRPTDELRSVVETSALPVVVFARRGPAEGAAVVSALRAGVVTIVDGPSVRVLVAHLDAVLRRRCAIAS